MPITRSLENLIFEIALRATAKVCEGFEPSRIEAIAKPLALALTDIVVEQGNDPVEKYPVEVSNYIIFEIWNQIMDEVVKEIPIGSRVEITGNKFTRTDRAKFLRGDWRVNGGKRDTATSDRD